jgi:CDK-activating kinase assembly factor MAT1
MESNETDLYRCAICCQTESDSSNLTQSTLHTNTVVGCGHQFCIVCVERELSRRKTFPCPICETIVKRSTLSTRTLDDVQCEKDTSWRRRINKVYNKVQSDFGSLLEYNNYLEEVEDLIYNIVNGEPNAEECKAVVKKHEEENKSDIAIRQSQRADEERLIQDRYVLCSMYCTILYTIYCTVMHNAYTVYTSLYSLLIRINHI